MCPKLTITKLTTKAYASYDIGASWRVPVYPELATSHTCVLYWLNCPGESWCVLVYPNIMTAHPSSLKTQTYITGPMVHVCAVWWLGHQFSKDARVCLAHCSHSATCIKFQRMMWSQCTQRSSTMVRWTQFAQLGFNLQHWFTLLQPCMWNLLLNAWTQWHCAMHVLCQYS
jgi:hypothetical protein